MQTGTSARPGKKHDEKLKPVFWLAFSFLCFSILKYAWVGEDSYIAWRVADNFIHGHGLRWNTAERVQVYTDPFFLLLITFFYKLTHELYLVVIGISLLLSAGSAWLAVRLMRPNMAVACLGMVFLISSKAFTDYATSGLENPLSYLLLVLFSAEALTGPMSLRKFSLMCLWASLAAFNRLDCIIPCMPLLLYALYQCSMVQKLPFLRIIGKGLLYSAQLWLWLIFATVYYGFPLPNTYYSKLNAGIPAIRLWIIAPFYFIESLENDTPTLLGIILCIFAGFRGRNTAAKFLAAGLALYLVYVCSVGGDFMSGRFFSVPAMLCLPLLFTLNIGRTAAAALSTGCLAIGLTVPQPAVLPYKLNYNYGADAGSNGIADERAAWFPVSGLFPWYNGGDRNANPASLATGRQLQLGKPLPENIAIGFIGFGAGPDVHLLDPYGLGDPFISKLPFNWTFGYRPGHYLRFFPPEYRVSLLSGRNLFTEKHIADLYNDVMLASRASLFASGRMAAIWRLNTGAYKPLAQHWVPEIKITYWLLSKGQKAPDSARVYYPAGHNAFGISAGFFSITDSAIVMQRDTIAEIACPQGFFIKQGSYRMLAEIKAETPDSALSANANNAASPGAPLAEMHMHSQKPEAHFSRSIQAKDLPADGKYHTISLPVNAAEDMIHVYPSFKTINAPVKISVRRIRIVWDGN
ncbi:MAG: hypothetical protein V4543_11760 [Bacteroidota bacterium]